MLAQVGLAAPSLAVVNGGVPLAIKNISPGLFTNVTVIHSHVFAFEAAQNIAPVLVDEGDLIYDPLVVQDAAPGQILVKHFIDDDQIYDPVFALEPAKIISVGYFQDPDTFHMPQVFGEGTDLQIMVIGRYRNPNYFLTPTFTLAMPEPKYTYPIGHGLYSDYGIRASKTFYKKRLIIGSRR